MMRPAVHVQNVSSSLYLYYLTNLINKFASEPDNLRRKKLILERKYVDFPIDRPEFVLIFHHKKRLKYLEFQKLVIDFCSTLGIMVSKGSPETYIKFQKPSNFPFRSFPPK